MKNNILFKIGIVSSFFFFAYLVFAYNPGTNFIICTSTVNQPSCYSGGYPTPTVNWTMVGGSSQISYQVQIDQNQNFNNPEIDSGIVNSTNKFYEVNTSGLSYGTNYYWRVRVKDNYNSWSNWVEAESSFVTVQECQEAFFITSEACSSNPTATNLNVSSHNPTTYCGTALHNFSWTYTDEAGKNQSRFRFQVDNNSNFSSPEIDRDYSGLSNPSPATNNQVAYVATNPTSDKLVYNQTYYWRVEVWNSSNDSSGWVNGSSFSTANHAYPDVDFSWEPSSPSANEEVQFTDETSCSVNCSSWSWNFEDGTPLTSGSQNPIIKFNSEGLKQTTLQVTDSSNYSCSLSKNVNVSNQLPEWKEILP